MADGVGVIGGSFAADPFATRRRLFFGVAGGGGIDAALSTGFLTSSVVSNSLTPRGVRCRFFVLCSARVALSSNLMACSVGAAAETRAERLSDILRGPGRAFKYAAAIRLVTDAVDMCAREVS